MDVTLRTQTENPRLALRQITWTGEPAGFSAVLDLWSDDFGARKQFWFTRWGVEQFLAALRVMDSSLSGAAVLGDEHEPDHFSLKVTATGRVVVSGELFRFGACEQRLEFGFETDQTVLAPLIAELDGLLAHVAA
jgi:hypothetical protein